MSDETEILLSFYGDDFTGSSDVMESLSLMGIPTILFMRPPTRASIENFNWQGRRPVAGSRIAFGVAGIARSLGPDDMRRELEPIFRDISQVPTRFFHYKMCSTLDSAPEIGNIGVAMEVAEKYFPSDFIPLMLGLPVLNRFVIFGNLFARIGSETFRLDRHPVMSQHPVTPMKESDIRRHLSHQMDRKMGLVDFFALEKLSERTPDDIVGPSNAESKAPLVLFDTLEDRQLPIIGRWISDHSRPKHQLLLGSSAVEYALGHVYGEPKWLSIEPKAITPTLIVAGSCSQTTADQLQYVAGLGYEMVRMEVGQLFGDEQKKVELQRIVDESVQHLLAGKNTVIYSAMGPSDPSVQTTLSSTEIKKQPQAIASAQASATRAIIDRFPVKRLVTAGGDTSGYIIKELGITALEFKNVLAPGAPLCIAHSDRQAISGLEIAIKGGQNGTVKYFEYAQKGGSS